MPHHAPNYLLATLPNLRISYIPSTRLLLATTDLAFSLQFANRTFMGRPFGRRCFVEPRRTSYSA